MKTFLTGAVPTKKFSIRMQFVSLGKISYTFWSSNLFCQKSFFARIYKFLQILIHTDKTRETIINVWYLTDVQHYFTDKKRYIR